MHSDMDDTEVPGFPIQTSQDQRLVANSPGLIAGSNVFHRLLTPSHPPHTLNSLITPTCDRRKRRHKSDQSAVTITQRPAFTRPQTDGRASTSKHLIRARFQLGITLQIACNTKTIHLSKSVTGNVRFDPFVPAPAGCGW